MKQNMNGMDIEIVKDHISYREIITEKLYSLEREVSNFFHSGPKGHLIVKKPFT